MSDATARSALAAVQNANTQAAADNGTSTTVKRMFMLFHGWYGNLFLSKFATGELDGEGKDKGIKSARMVWSFELARFDADTIMAAASRCKEVHKSYPPSLPEFLDLCRACAPRPTASRQQASVGMSSELRSQYSRRARDAATSALKARMDATTGYVEVQSGLAGLKQAIANAIACAGGDEAQALCRLDREISARRVPRAA
jgi:hypothetical protein